jgi:hypothetical protein
MSLNDGQSANAAVFNAAFLSKTQGGTTIGVIDLDAPSSGNQVVDAQAAINEIADCIGQTDTADQTTGQNYTSNEVVTDSTTHKAAISALDAEFNASSGHGHSGVAGDGGPISAATLSGINYYRADWQTTSVASYTGASQVVSSAFSGKLPTGGASSVGVLTFAPNNKIDIRVTSSGEQLEDGLGNKVYARITESAGVWTATNYIYASGAESAYTITTTQNVDLYFREVFTLATYPTIPSDVGMVGSLNLTADIADGSATQRGLVTTTTQTMAGDKTLTGHTKLGGRLIIDQAVDSISTGASATLPTPTKVVSILTNASLTSIEGVAANATDIALTIVNSTGASITIKNDTGTAANRIITGTGFDFTFLNGACILLIYETNSSRWRMIGGGGSGTGGTGGSLLDVKTKNVSYSLTTADEVILCDFTSERDLSLPTAVGNTGKTFYIKKISVNNSIRVNIYPFTAQKIDGGSMYILLDYGDSIRIVSDGTQWWVI